MRSQDASHCPEPIAGIPLSRGYADLNRNAREDIHMYQRSLVSPPKRDGINHADDTIAQRAVLAPPSAVQRPAKARAHQESMPAEHI